MDKVSEERFDCHPLKQYTRQFPQARMPIRMRGDDAPTGKSRHATRSIRTACWSAATTKSASLTSRFLAWAIDPSIIKDDQPLWATLAWSFNVMASGVFPTLDPLGQPWTDRARRAKAGSKLSPQGEIAVFCQFASDWKFALEVVCFEQSYRHTDVCRWCFAKKAAGDLNYANAADDAPWTGARRTNGEYLNSLSRRGLEPRLQRTLGFHHECCHDDYMHDDLLGVRLDFNASTMKVLADTNFIS
jgi:hypothetical protein